MTSNVELRFIISIVENPTDMITVDLNSFPEFDVWVKKYLKYEKNYEGEGKNYYIVDLETADKLYFSCREALTSEERAKQHFNIDEITPQNCYNLTMIMRFCYQIGLKFPKRKESSAKICFKIVHEYTNPRE